jgi:hypothetical protein
MASKSLITWRTEASLALDELEAAHSAIGGHGPGRRYATQQINFAYTVLLCGRFQAFCRDLHSECADYLAFGGSSRGSLIVTPRTKVFRALLTQSRKLDTGNPNPGNLGSDFGRLGIQFWDAMRANRPTNIRRQAMLEQLTIWRNAIAHQDFTNPKLGGRNSMNLRDVRQWRNCCNALATSIDGVLSRHLAAILGYRLF